MGGLTPAQARRDYARALGDHGERVGLRRYGSGAASADDLRARVRGFTAQELASGLDQGSRKVILLAEDVEASGFPTLRKNDLLVVRGAEKSIESVDDSTRRIAGVLIAYELTVMGW